MKILEQFLTATIEWLVKSPSSRKIGHQAIRIAPVASDFKDDAIPASWLVAYPLGLMVEYTSRCNLRCRYCTKSNPGDAQVPGRDMDMSPHTLDTVMQCVSRNRFQEVLLAGTGESTFNPRWTEDFPRLIAACKAANPICFVHLNSNFALKYADEHWAVLAQLDGIAISIDTSDRRLTREVRARSDLDLIFDNIRRFSAYCGEQGLMTPRIAVNVTLYNEAAAGLPKLIEMLSCLPVSHVAISDLFETEAAVISGIRQINADQPDSFVTVAKHIQSAIRISNTLGRFTISLQLHLAQRMSEIEALLNQGSMAKTVEDELATSACGESANTKICLQPWTRFTLASDAALYPCCVTSMQPTGSLGAMANPLKDGLDGERMQHFCRALLTGNVPESCRKCTNAPSGPVIQLQQAVQTLASGG